LRPSWNGNTGFLALRLWNPIACDLIGNTLFQS
jgi:hypothetical protein